MSRDQNVGKGNRQGKEICDLLTIFDRHVIIFSDKYCDFSEASVETAWGRWYRKAISASGKQINGAERWLKQHPDRVFTDLSCQHKLPLQIPSGPDVRFHRIIIAHGASQACRQYYPGSRGSLVLDNRIKGDTDHISRPFHIGQADPDQGFIHVFDDVTLDLVLRTLDTVSDFTAYLEKKELLLSSTRVIVAAGEEELLGSYFIDLNEKQEHDFVLPDNATNVLYSEGRWDHFLQSEERKGQVRANQISYSWDALIEKFTSHTLAGTHRTTTQETTADQEILYRWLARENRTRRRMLARSFIGIILKTPKGFRAMRLIEPSSPGDPYFLFLVVPRTGSITEDQYREIRQWLLGQYCTVLKLKYPDALDVVGIATETGNDEKNRSEDLLYVDLRDWDEEMAVGAREVQKQLGLMTHVNRIAGTEQEFPREQSPLRGPAGLTTISRNKKCPCKSGKRYSKCCGKGKFARA